MPSASRASGFRTVGRYDGSRKISLHGPCECLKYELSKSTRHRLVFGFCLTTACHEQTPPGKLE